MRWAAGELPEGWLPAARPVPSGSSLLLIRTQNRKRSCAAPPRGCGRLYGGDYVHNGTLVQVGQPRYGGTFAAGAGELPFVLPGERLAGGELLQASPERVLPGCVHFGVCGGCQYQHAAYPAQLRLKREVLEALLADAGIHGVPSIASHAAEQWGYRNRIRLRVRSVDGALRVGYNRRGSNDFLPITMCPIATPLLWRAATVLLQNAAEDALARRWMSSVSEVELFCLSDETRLQASFFLRDSDPAHGDPTAFARFCEGVKERMPELATAGAELDPELSRRARRAWAGATWGAAGLVYPAAGRDYWVSRGAFFQVNRFLVDRLVDLVCDGQQGALAWDLFAGVGLFTRPLADRFGRVVAVEGGETAAAALAVAGRQGKLFDAVRAPTLEFLRARERQRERPELVVLDPPRAGLGAEASGLLARIAPARLVYVSCDPTTLARDLVVLVRGGYRLETVELIDLFPQTYHMETVVRLARG